MIFAQIHDVVWQALIAACLAVVMFLLGMWKEYLERRRAKILKADLEKANAAAAAAAAAAARKVAEVRQDLHDSTRHTEEQLDTVIETGDKVHTLVNANMGVQLKLNMVVTRRLANLTKGTPDGSADEEAAMIAQQMYVEHIAKQGVVDAGH